MPELSEEPDLVRIHALFSQRDLDRLDRATGHVMKRSKALRVILRKFLDEVDARSAARATPAAQLADVDLT